MISQRRCAVCGEVVGAVTWLLMNRFAVGTGRNHGFTSCVAEGDGSYVWEIDEPSDMAATGQVLHWPDCAVKYVEGKMAECDFEVERK